MESFLKVLLVLGVSSAVTSVPLPPMHWTDHEISAMATVSCDYYNMGSNEESVFQLVDTNEYYVTKSSGLQKLHFCVRETICKKSNGHITDHCALKEGGLVKTCTASFFSGEEDQAILVTCDTERNDHTLMNQMDKNRGGWDDGTTKSEDQNSVMVDLVKLKTREVKDIGELCVEVEIILMTFVEM
ncbi:15 kDa protein B-like [Pelodytes ibericus]